MNMVSKIRLYALIVPLMVAILCVLPLGIGAQDHSGAEEVGKEEESESDTPEGYIYTWPTNVEEAVEESEGKHVLLYFAGSDWCPHCMRFEEEVIDTLTFRRYLEENYVPVLIDSPRYYTLSEEQSDYNQARLAEYEVRGFPTMVILDSDGEVVTSLGYNQQGANGFIKTLKNELR